MSRHQHSRVSVASRRSRLRLEVEPSRCLHFPEHHSAAGCGNGLAGTFTSLTNQSLLNQHRDDMPVCFVQEANDIAHREPVICEKIANGDLSLGD